MPLWPFRRRHTPDFEGATFDRVDFDDFSGFADEENPRENYLESFEDVYDPRFDDFYH